jgi:hypothetical protein
MTNPADGISKLLLVMGRDAADLKVAVDALALGAKMTGPAAKVQAVDKPARAAYDAPTTVRLVRPVRLAEVLKWPKQLETAGKPPALPTVSVDLSVPPDLATWRGPGVPVDLRVQYHPGPCTSESQLEMALNGEPLMATALRTSNEQITQDHEFYIPAYRMRTRMRLQFTFRFTPKDEARCRENPPTIKAAVSPESTLDFSGFPHYAQMPNLNHFASVGYPFTKFADLSQTVVVLPERPVAADIEAMLGLMGRMGEATGYPATRVRLATSRDEAQLADADLLLVGATPQQALMVKWAGLLPVTLTGYAQRVSRPPTRLAPVYAWLGMGTQQDLPPANPVSFDGGAPIATVLGFESPVTAGRSRFPSELKSPTAIDRGLVAAAEGRGDLNVPLPLPSSTLTPSTVGLATTRSSRPSLLKSAAAIS